MIKLFQSILHPSLFLFLILVLLGIHRLDFNISEATRKSDGVRRGSKRCKKEESIVEEIVDGRFHDEKRTVKAQDIIAGRFAGIEVQEMI